VSCDKNHRSGNVGEANGNFIAAAHRRPPSARVAYLPTGIFERAQQLIQQPDIYDLTAEIVTLQSIFTQTGESLAEGDPLDKWRNFQELFATMDRLQKRIIDAYSRGYEPEQLDVEIYRETMVDTRALVKACSDSRAVQKELYRQAPILGKLQEQQAAIDTKLQEFVPATKVQMLFMVLLNGIYEVIPDTQQELRNQLAGVVRRTFLRPDVPVSRKNPQVAAALAAASAPTDLETIIDVEPDAIEAEIITPEDDLLEIFEASDTHDMVEAAEAQEKTNETQIQRVREETQTSQAPASETVSASLPEVPGSSDLSHTTGNDLHDEPNASLPVPRTEDGSSLG
jgi:hypothetical protein